MSFLYSCFAKEKNGPSEATAIVCPWRRHINWNIAERVPNTYSVSVQSLFFVIFFFFFLAIFLHSAEKNPVW